MLTMTDIESPKFSLATPEDFKQASEKVMHFWVGAMSPLWVPFWAASSFGLGAWALTKSLSRAEGLRDLPLAGQWPGFSGAWAKEALKIVEDDVVAPAEAVVAVVEETVEVVAEKTVAAAEDVTETVAEAAAPVVEDTTKAVESAADEVVAETKPLIDPVTEVPVVPAVVDAIAETPVVEAVKVEAPDVTPKPIAKTLSAAKPKPATTRAKAPKS